MKSRKEKKSDLTASDINEKLLGSKEIIDAEEESEEE